MKYSIIKAILLLISAYLNNIVQTTNRTKLENEKRNIKTVVNIYFGKHFRGDTIYIKSTPRLRDRFDASQLNEDLPKRDFFIILDSLGHGSLRYNQEKQIEYLFIARDFNQKFGVYTPLIDNYLIGRGDSINIFVESNARYKNTILSYADANERHYKLRFSGSIGNLFSFYQYDPEEDQIFSELHRSYIPYIDEKGSLNPNDTRTAELKATLGQLNKLKNSLSSLMYATAKADLIGSYLYDVGRLVSKFNKLRIKDSILLDNLYHSKFSKLLNLYLQDLSSESKTYSKACSPGVYLIEKDLFKLKYSNIDGRFYNLIKRKYKDGLRDNLFNLYFNDPSTEALPNLDSLYADATKITRDPSLREKFHNSHFFSKGSPIKKFQFETLSGKEINIETLRDKIVFVDFYFSGCTGCSEYYQNVLKQIEDKLSNSQDIIFLSVCADASKVTWEEAINSNKYTSKDHANVLNLTTGAFGFDHPLLKYYQIHTFPTPFILDKQGNLIDNGAKLRDKSYLQGLLNTLINQKRTI